MHLPQHQQMLKEANSETLYAVVEHLKKDRPAAFHVESGIDETLSQRRLAYEPATALPMAGFNVARGVAKAKIEAVGRKAE